MANVDGYWINIFSSAPLFPEVSPHHLDLLMSDLAQFFTLDKWAHLPDEPIYPGLGRALEPVH